MEAVTIEKLRMLEAKHGTKPAPKKRRLKVFYGWARLGKVRKRESISIIFENEEGAGCETQRSHKTLKKMQDTVFERFQTDEEAQDASFCRQVFTEYCVFMDEKSVNGSLEKALQINSERDKNHVSKQVRKEIADKLRTSFLASHQGYVEPVRQLEFDFL